MLKSGEKNMKSEKNLTEKEQWIQNAISKPGALRSKAKRAGAVKSDGTIEKSWIKNKAKGDGQTARQARLAMTLSKLRKNK